jgi:hypothetical protein
MRSDLRTALLVTYVWPPTGGVGQYRVLKLAKYLPSHGVTPSVLTVANPSVPLRDDSTAKDIPEGIEILKARTFEPSYATKQIAWEAASDAAADRPRTLKQRAVGTAAGIAKHLLAPDPQVLWQPDAQRALIGRALSRSADDVVFITAPPFSMFLAAPMLRALGRSALVLDYRDEWITYRTQFEMMGKLGRLLGEPMERAALRSAHMITTATDAFRDNLLSCFPFLDPARVVTIENGFDRDDFPNELPELPSDRFVVTYAGSLLVQNSPRGLMGAIRRLHAREPELARLLDVRFIGRVVDTEAKWFEGMEELGVSRSPYVDKAKVLPMLAESHMVLCLLDHMPGAERIYPAKVFELMVLGRPCLTLAPEGALTTFARRHNLGPVLAPRDEEAIAAELERALRAFKEGRYKARSEPVDVDRFDRRITAGRFADVFREALRLHRA